MPIVRYALALPFLLIAVIVAIVSMVPDNERLMRHSLQNQLEMHADMKRIGAFTEAYRTQHGRIPTREQVLDWMGTQDFEYRFFDEVKGSQDEGFGLDIVGKDEECLVGEASQLPEASKHTYRICYWNNWTEEYAPQTGAHTFATSIDEYRTPLWIRALVFAFAASFGGLAYLVGIWQPARRATGTLE